MADVLETVTIRGDGIALDLLLWRRFGRQGLALVEMTLALNPGLAATGLDLPLGTSVKLPVPPASTPFVAEPVSLFE
jgi:phage tail protein X